jgi:hypothetical protein
VSIMWATLFECKVAKQLAIAHDAMQQFSLLKGLVSWNGKAYLTASRPFCTRYLNFASTTTRIHLKPLEASRSSIH